MRCIILSLAYVCALFVAPHNAVAVPGAGVIVSTPPTISTSACYNINDADARAVCLARANRDPGRCYSVQRPDLRSVCLAEARR